MVFQRETDDWQSQREIMVAKQLVRRGICDERVLAAFREVPRHEFVPQKLRYSAYEDHPIPLGYAQTISQPYMVAVMTELLRLQGPENVLEIGSGSGYQAAILGQLCRQVCSIERIKELTTYASQNIMRLGYGNIIFLTGDGTKGVKPYAPYNGIVVTAGSPVVPQSLIDQLAIGGRLVIPVGSAYSQTLTVIEKKDKKNVVQEHFGCVFVPLIGEEGWKE